MEEQRELRKLQEAVYNTAEELRFEASLLQVALNYHFNELGGADWYYEALQIYRSAEEKRELGESLIEYIHQIEPEREWELASSSTTDPWFSEGKTEDAPSSDTVGSNRAVNKALEAHSERLNEMQPDADTSVLETLPLINSIGDYNSLKGGYLREIEFIEPPEDGVEEEKLVEDEDAALIQN